MFVVLPVCHKDVWLAVKLMDWGKRLDGSTKYKCLIVQDDLCDVSELENAARGYFAEVKTFKYGHWTGASNQWPVPQNFQWQQTAGYIFHYKPFGNKPWFWWEPDATPVKAGWLDALKERHEQGGKPYTGHIVTGDPFQKKQQLSWMTGCGIYPWDAASRSFHAMSAVRVPWDVASGKEVVVQCARANDLIQHIWERDGAPFHFKDKADADSVLAKDAVIFHRCKDGSLMDALAGDGFMVRIARAVENGIDAIKGTLMSDEEPPDLPQDDKDSDTAIVQLGRLGDIVGVLPIAHEIYKQEGARPHFHAAEEFIGLLGGCSYVRPVPVKTSWQDPLLAEEQASLKHKRVIRTQVHGPGARRGEPYDSFMTAMWANAGMAGDWHRLPLVFDRRSPRREKKLVRQNLSHEHRVGVSMSGLSSPLPKETVDKLMERLRGKFGAAVVDLSDVRGEQLYDMLGIFDRLDCLVASDSSLLHLSYATRIPTVALVADKPTMWYGTRARKHWVGNYRYSIVPLSLDAIIEDIEWGMKNRTARLIHVYSDYKGDAETERRKAVAREACALEYREGRWIACPVPDAELPRQFKDGNRKLPFIHDVLNYGLNRARPDDIVVYTNSDIALAPGATAQILKHFETFNAGYSYRRDFDKLTRPLSAEEVMTGRLYSGADLFAVRAHWWRYKKDWFPDFPVGGEAWDWCMRRYYDTNHDKPAVIPDCIYHERHQSEWEKNKKCQANIVSRAYARQFLSKIGDYHGEFELR